ncbi:CLC_0170 family protein [Bacillus sp. JJ1562]|uniref:CLC_0170 family protein n=1 Tax=Bacillus sp. JJ1562 TaxID=3122960 RepID=UPI003F68B02F
MYNKNSKSGYKGKVGFMYEGVEMIFIGYLNYVVILSVTTGVLILLFDVKNYKKAKMKKEQKVSKVLGWLNISAGLFVLILNWVYQKIYW